jgi:hypothetical protein
MIKENAVINPEYLHRPELHFRSWLCVDCGFNTFPSMPSPAVAIAVFNAAEQINLTIDEDCEVYIVKESIWKRAGSPDGCLCVGCLEKRVGRRLKPRDFLPDHVFNRAPATPRLTSRRSR